MVDQSEADSPSGTSSPRTAKALGPDASKNTPTASPRTTAARRGTQRASPMNDLLVNMPKVLQANQVLTPRWGGGDQKTLARLALLHLDDIQSVTYTHISLVMFVFRMG